MKEIKFDTDGDLHDDVIHPKIRVRKETLTGEEAIAYLAALFAGETHGNYSAETLYKRANLGDTFEITIKLK